MLNLCIHVGVVGFSDVERHALNTIFRLSEEREVAYAPWVPLVAQGTGISVTGPEVVLVDGESAEAVLFHARPSPEGQRVIWVGDDAPEHAWRVLTRPMSWSSLLEDLDAVYAARQVDSGLLVLDITSPGGLEDLQDRPGVSNRRALLVGLDAEDNDLAAEPAGCGRCGRSRCAPFHRTGGRLDFAPLIPVWCVQYRQPPGGCLAAVAPVCRATTPRP